jgi:hydrogenase nickel incorporation protein HypA/HybF
MAERSKATVLKTVVGQPTGGSNPSPSAHIGDGGALSLAREPHYFEDEIREKMHELSVTEGLLNITLRHAEQAEAKRVTTLHIVVGRLSSIVDDSVQFYWDIISKDTIAEGAMLHFQRIPIELECLNCGQRYTPEVEDFACPNCKSEQIKIIAGEEFYLDSIEVE